MLPEEQCGLDLVTVLQCTADAYKDAKKEILVGFVDLRKAFDSVDRASLYNVLAKLGVPPIMLATIEDLHDGLQAKVFSEGQCSEPFAVSTGVRQGCCLAPILFSLYFAIVISDWKRSVQPRTRLKSRMDGDLHRQFTGNTAMQLKDHIIQVNLLDAEFADDLIVFADSAQDLNTLVTGLYGKMESWGFQMSDKTVLVVKLQRSL